MGQSSNSDAPLVWIDMEMTGLEPDTDEVLEIAIVITDKNLNVIAKGPDLVIKKNANQFAKMDAWNQEHHTKSGLWKAALSSQVTLQQAEESVLNFVMEHTQKKESPLCGNSVWQDRRFLYRHMPKLEEYLHYRIIDVSTIKELAHRWYPKEETTLKKESRHRAMDDIIESIEELKFYREKFFKPVKSDAPGVGK